MNGNNLKRRWKMNEVTISESKPLDAKVLQSVLLAGDLAALSPDQQNQYYLKVCETLGLNPTTRPFDLIKFNGKVVLYANKGCAEQLRMIYDISVKVTSKEVIDEIYVVTVEGNTAKGRVDSATGAINVKGLSGEAKANAYLKCETKAKRRLTLSICGLNMLDETEVDTIPGAERISHAAGADQPGPEDGDPNAEHEYTIPFGQWARRTIPEVVRNNSIAIIEKYMITLDSYIQTGKYPENHEKFKDFQDRMTGYLADLENGDAKE